MKNPVTHALLAYFYILTFVLILNSTAGMDDEKIGIMGPIAFLSVFVMSAAVMGYLFLGTPLQMYLDGQKKEAVAFFFKTLGTFAGMTVVTLLFMLLRIKS